MNYINQTHFGASEGCAPSLETALNRLGSWLDAEQETLGGVLAQAGRDRANHALEELSQMHLEPWSGETELRDLLEDALGALEYMLETVRVLPTNFQLQTAWGLAGPASFDRHVCWSGARLQDIVDTLRHALDA